MIYTVGHTESYDEALRGADPVKKIGICQSLPASGGKFYGGGIVFRTAEEARDWLIANCKGAIWSVYEVRADWHRHSYSHAGGCRRLLVDSVVTRKVAV